ncbi:MAG TPA: NAD(P)H-dependent oxidoreductase [Flavobacteriaceae bacterium]|nr:NAD(P)H-dependent oxidoreductase [Flavobacteriaceae bacterium]
MKKILAFSSSNSKNSINHHLVSYVAGTILNHEVNVIRLIDYDLPMFSEDLEKEKGYPLNLQMLKNVIDAHDAIIISVNEHNRGPSAFFKNIMDWLSRMDRYFLKEKKALVMSASTGANAARASLAYTKDTLFPRFGAEVLESFGFPSFNENFDLEANKITDELLYLGLTEVVHNFEQQLNF